MSDFPTLLYRIPGIHRLNGTQTFDYIGATDEDHFEALRADGWFPTIEAALSPDEVPAARADLETKAKDLGVSFNWKTSDDALMERIAVAEATKESAV